MLGSFATEPSELRHIPISAMPPIATKELQRFDWLRWAMKRREPFHSITLTAPHSFRPEKRETGFEMNSI